jgi:hypothetical protein
MANVTLTKRVEKEVVEHITTEASYQANKENYLADGWRLKVEAKAEAPVAKRNDKAETGEAK